MAAGAILPPLFFGQPPHRHFRSRHLASSRTRNRKTPQDEITRFERPARSSPTNRAITAEG
jgi:hypothetical protein